MQAQGGPAFFIFVPVHFSLSKGIMLQGILAFEWFGLSGNAWFTIVVVLLLFAAMIFSKLRVDIIFLLGMCALYLSGVLDLKTAFGGFSSASVIIIAVLYAVIAGLNYTGVLNWVVKHMMGSPSHHVPRGALEFVPHQHHGGSTLY